nr:RagB/SusD family nutrient uptake outer membrane protein [Allomuricauda sp.]
MRYLKNLTVLVVIAFWSCDDFLDTPPESQISLSDFWQTRSDAELGVAAAYDELQNAFESNFWVWGELRGDNYTLNDRPSADTQNQLTNNLQISTGGADWSDLYAAIATANVAIQQIPEIPDFANKNDLLAQSLAIRALCYFYAVRVWGGVPKVTALVDDVSGDINIPRSPLNEIYNEIILPDLAEAEALIQTPTSRNFFSLGSILALKAHVYAWPGAHQNYQMALDAINELEGLGYSLETSTDGWANIFPSESSNEIIFWLAWNFAEDTGNGGHAQFAGFTPDKVPAETLEAKWSAAIPGDFRILESAAFDIEIEDPMAEFPFLRIMSKFFGVFDDRGDQADASANNDFDIPFFRLSGLMLLKAEIQNYLNDGAGALASVNSIRTARGLPNLVGGTDVDTGNQTAMRDLILDERQFELMGEGQRFWDLVRNGVAVEVMSQVIDITSGNLNGLDREIEIVWPVSQNVLDRNPNIEQNEAYR